MERINSGYLFVLLFKPYIMRCLQISNALRSSVLPTGHHTIFLIFSQCLAFVTSNIFTRTRVKFCICEFFMHMAFILYHSAAHSIFYAMSTGLTYPSLVIHGYIILASLPASVWVLWLIFTCEHCK